MDLRLALPAILLVASGSGCDNVAAWDAGCSPDNGRGWHNCNVQGANDEDCDPPVHPDYRPWACGPSLCDEVAVTLVVDPVSDDLISSRGLDSAAGTCMFNALLADEPGTLDLRVVVDDGEATTDPLELSIHLRGDGSAVADVVTSAPAGHCPSRQTEKSAVLQLSAPALSCATETDPALLGACAFESDHLILTEGIGPSIFTLLGPPIQSEAPSCG